MATINNRLLSLGFHIGHQIQTVKNQLHLNKFVIGVRNNYHVIDISVSIFFLKKALTFIWSSNLSHCNNMFYYSSISIDTDNSSSNLLVKSFLQHLIFQKTSSSFIHMKWTNGLITNYRVCFLRFIKIVASYYKKRRYNYLVGSSRLFTNDFFFTFFIKLLFILREKTKLKLDILLEFNKVLPLAKVIIFLRFWKTYFTIPDIAYVVNSNNLYSPIHEFNSVKVPIVSITDTASAIGDITYAIPFNDDSVVMVFFFFSIVSNVIRSSRISFFQKKIK